MLEIKSNNEIQLTRGDTARITVDIINKAEDGKKYEMQEDDILRFTVKKDYRKPDAAIRKECQGSSVIHIKPEDTEGLEFGNYAYDVELKTGGGDVYTIIEPSRFEIMKEVSWQ